MKKTKKYDYAANLSDGYPVVNQEVKPYIPPEKPHYGKPNFGYNFIVKYGKAMQINTFIAMVVFVCLMAVTLFMTNIDVSKHQVNATTTVFLYIEAKSKPSGWNDSWRVFGNPNIVWGYQG